MSEALQYRVLPLQGTYGTALLRAKQSPQGWQITLTSSRRFAGATLLAALQNGTAPMVYTRVGVLSPQGDLNVLLPERGTIATLWLADGQDRILAKTTTAENRLPRSLMRPTPPREPEPPTEDGEAIPAGVMTAEAVSAETAPDGATPAGSALVGVASNGTASVGSAPGEGASVGAKPNGAASVGVARGESAASETVVANPAPIKTDAGADWMKAWPISATEPAEEEKSRGPMMPGQRTSVQAASGQMTPSQAARAEASGPDGALIATVSTHSTPPPAATNDDAPHMVGGFGMVGTFNVVDDSGLAGTFNVVDDSGDGGTYNTLGDSSQPEYDHLPYGILCMKPRDGKEDQSPTPAAEMPDAKPADTETSDVGMPNAVPMSGPSVASIEFDASDTTQPQAVVSVALDGMDTPSSSDDADITTTSDEMDALFTSDETKGTSASAGMDALLPPEGGCPVEQCLPMDPPAKEPPTETMVFFDDTQRGKSPWRPQGDSPSDIPARHSQMDSPPDAPTWNPQADPPSEAPDWNPQGDPPSDAPAWNPQGYTLSDNPPFPDAPAWNPQKDLPFGTPDWPDVGASEPHPALPVDFPPVGPSGPNPVLPADFPPAPPVDPAAEAWFADVAEALGAAPLADFPFANTSNMASSTQPADAQHTPADDQNHIDRLFGDVEDFLLQ